MENEKRLDYRSLKKGDLFILNREDKTLWKVIGLPDRVLSDEDYAPYVLCWETIASCFCGVEQKIALLVVGKKQRDENHFYLTLEEACPDSAGFCNWGWVDRIFRLTGASKPLVKKGPVIDGGVNRNCLTCAKYEACKAADTISHGNDECYLRCEECENGPKPDPSSESSVCAKCLRLHGYHLNWQPKKEEKQTKKAPMFDAMHRACINCERKEYCNPADCRLNCVECVFGPKCDTIGKAECRQCLAHFSWQLLFKPKLLSKRVEVPKDERCCRNCEYVNRGVYKKPCIDCDEDESHFKPAEWYLEKKDTGKNSIDIKNPIGIKRSFPIKMTIVPEEIPGPTDITIDSDGFIEVRTKIE